VYLQHFACCIMETDECSYIHTLPVWLHSLQPGPLPGNHSEDVDVSDFSCHIWTNFRLDVEKVLEAMLHPKSNWLTFCAERSLNGIIAVMSAPRNRECHGWNKPASATHDEGERRIESRIAQKHRLAIAYCLEKNRLAMKLSGLDPQLYSFVTDSSYCSVHGL